MQVANGVATVIIALCFSIWCLTLNWCLVESTGTLCLPRNTSSQLSTFTSISSTCSFTYSASSAECAADKRHLTSDGSYLKIIIQLLQCIQYIYIKSFNSKIVEQRVQIDHLNQSKSVRIVDQHIEVNLNLVWVSVLLRKWYCRHLQPNFSYSQKSNCNIWPTFVLAIKFVALAASW